MEKKDILQRLEAIFQDVFDDESLCIDENTNAEDIEDWDSLMQITLLVAIEKEFDVKFAMEELEMLSSVERIINIIIC